MHRTMMLSWEQYELDQARERRDRRLRKDLARMRRRARVKAWVRDCARIVFAAALATAIGYPLVKWLGGF